MLATLTVYFFFHAPSCEVTVYSCGTGMSIESGCPSSSSVFCGLATRVKNLRLVPLAGSMVAPSVSVNSGARMLSAVLV